MARTADLQAGRGEERISAAEIVRNPRAALKRVAGTKERLIVFEGGKDIVVVISIAEYRQLREACEDAWLAEEADRRLADPSDAVIPYEQARRNLGLA